MPTVNPPPAAPDLEDLAAYLDGALSPDERERVESRLAEDSSFYEIFLETVRTLEEERSEPADAPVGSRRRIGWGVLGTVAAIFLLVLGIRYTSIPSDWESHLDASRIVEAAARDGRSWDDPGWRRWMGPESPDASTSASSIFRLGVRAADARIAFEAGLSSRARAHLGEMASLAEEAGLVAATAELRRLASSEDEIVALDTLEEIVENLENETRRLGPTPGRRFLLGRWVEAARLAAVSGDRQALESILDEAPPSPELDALPLRRLREPEEARPVLEAFLREHSG